MASSNTIATAYATQEILIVLGGVGGGGEGVGGEDRQPDRLADGLVGRVRGGQGPPDEPRSPRAGGAGNDLAVRLYAGQVRADERAHSRCRSREPTTGGSPTPRASADLQWRASPVPAAAAGRSPSPSFRLNRSITRR